MRGAWCRLLRLALWVQSLSVPGGHLVPQRQVPSPCPGGWQPWGRLLPPIAHAQGLTQSAKFLVSDRSLRSVKNGFLTHFHTQRIIQKTPSFPPGRKQPLRHRDLE